MAAHEEAAEQEAPVTARDEAMWAEVEQRLRSVLPDLESFVGGSRRELTHLESGLQLSLSAAEISLSVPYWYEGAEAERLTEILRTVVQAVEEVTGRVAFDPQAELPFLAGGDEAAPQAFDEVGSFFADQGLTSGRGTLPSTEAPRRSLWRRLFGQTG